MMLKVSKYLVHLFAAMGLIKVGSIGVNMIENDNGSFWLGIVIVSSCVIFTSLSTYVLSTKLSK